MNALKLGLSIDEFLNLQPQELRKIAKAYNERKKEEDFRRSYFVSWIVNCQLEKPVSVNDIYEPLWVSKEEKEKQMMDDREVLFKEFNLSK